MISCVLQEEFHINSLLLVEKIISYYKLGTQYLHGKFHFFSVNIYACNSAQLILFIIAPDRTGLGLIPYILKDNGNTQTQLTRNSSKSDEALSSDLHCSIFSRQWSIWIISS